MHMWCSAFHVYGLLEYLDEELQKPSEKWEGLLLILQLHTKEIHANLIRRKIYLT